MRGPRRVGTVVKGPIDMMSEFTGETVSLRRQSSKWRLHPAHLDRSHDTPRLANQDLLEASSDGAARRLYRVPSCPTLNALSRPLYPHLQDDLNRPKTQTNVLDLTHKAMTRYRVQPRLGRLLDAKDQAWDTGPRCAKFVMRPDGVLFAAVKERCVTGKDDKDGKRSKRTLHHSSFVRGPIAAAGLLHVRSGNLLYAICESGHYQPTPAMMGQFLETLARHGFELNGLPVGFHLGSRGLCWFDAAYVREHTDEAALTTERALPAPVCFRGTPDAFSAARKPA